MPPVSTDLFQQINSCKKGQVTHDKKIQCKRYVAWSCSFYLLHSTSAQGLILYEDTVTKQIYTESGKNRVKLGVFQQIKESPTQSQPTHGNEIPTEKNRPQGRWTALWGESMGGKINLQGQINHPF